MENSPAFSNLSILSNSSTAKNVILFFRIIVILSLLRIVVNISTALSIKGNQVSPLAVFISGIISAITVIAMIVLGIFFLIWMKRAYDNLHKSGIEDLRYSSGWAIAGWFIPITNFIVPFAIMREIWEKTQQTFFKEPVEEIYESSIVRYWWGFYILSGITSFLVYFYYEDGRIPQSSLESVYWILIAGNIFSLLSAFFGAKMIKDISTYENEMLERAEIFYREEVEAAAKNYLENQPHNFISQSSPQSFSSFPFPNGDKLELKGEVVDNERLAGFVIFGMYLLIGAAICVGFLSFHLYSNAGNSDFKETLTVVDYLFSKVQPIVGVIFLFVAISGFTWMRKSYSNLHNLGVHLSFKPALAFWGWFIPIGNLFIPFIIIQDINKNLQEVFEEKDLSVKKPVANSYLVNLLWIFFGLTFLFFLISVYYNQDDAFFFYRKPVEGAIFALFSSITGILALTIEIMLAKKISKLETEFFKIAVERFGEEEEENISEEEKKQIHKF